MRHWLAIFLYFAVNNCAVANPLLFAVTGEAHNTFGTLDTVTGVYTQISPLNLPSGFPAAGLAAPNTNLYTADFLGQQVAQIDRTTGAISNVHTSNLNFDAHTNNVYYGIGSVNGVMYAVVLGQGGASADPVLVQVDPTTGNVTLKGNIESGGTQLTTNGNFLTLSNGASQLYLSYDNSGNSTVTLYTVDVSTGALTQVGAGVTDTTHGQFGGLAFENGTLFGGSDSPTNTLYTVNTSTAGLSNQIFITGFPSGDSTFGLAQDLPEPVSSILTLIGLAGMLWLRRGQNSRML